METIEKKVIDYIKQDLYDGIDFKIDSDLIESKVINSMRIMKLITYLENEFEIEIEFDAVIADNFRNINNITKLVNDSMNAA